MSEVPTKFENDSEQMVSEGDFHQYGKNSNNGDNMARIYSYNTERIYVCILSIYAHHTHTIFGSQNCVFIERDRTFICAWKIFFPLITFSGQRNVPLVRNADLACFQLHSAFTFHLFGSFSLLLY